MARGLISLVAPVTAVVGRSCRSPTRSAVASVPAPLALVGIALAVARHRPRLARAGVGRSGAGAFGTLALAVAAGLLFGLFYVCLSRVDEARGLWPVPILRVGSAVGARRHWRS